MKLVLATFVVMLAVIADSSCASSERTFPHAKWDRINQNAYDSAFETAIVWKFVRELEHLDYVTFITPARALIWTTYVNCEAPQIQTEWLIKPGVCALTVPARHPGGCINFYGCAVVKASPSMLSDNRYREWIIEAIEKPCQALRDPNSYPDIVQRRMQAGLAYGISLEWAILSCGKAKEIQSKKFYIDEKTGLITIYFS